MSHNIAPIIQIDKVAVRIDGNQILANINLSIHPGELVMISGSNGAGKSTLIKSILGLLPTTEGSVFVAGLRVGSRAWRRVRHDVGYVHQTSVGVEFPITAAEVVEIGLAARRETRKQKNDKVDAAMVATGCRHLRNAVYARLSGGEKQRVSIARCLVQNPSILLLDEPTASLDPEGKDEFLSMIEHLHASRGITVVLVSHDAAQFTRAGWRQLVMSQGQLVTDNKLNGNKPKGTKPNDSKPEYLGHLAAAR
ncbi:MAG: ATP-binding cassette domain-containing protein [Spirochaetaceae bacterium]|nr:MAG: ATP-binding cassette domain-containing protein [Spirochaetaceae bacterium]